MKYRLRITLLFILTLPSLQLKAQQYFGPFTNSSRQFQDYYSEFIGEEEEIVSTWYHYVVTKKGDSFILRLFNPERKFLYSETVFADKRLKVKHGQYRKFDYNGKGYITGFYDQDEKAGIWKGFYTSGKPRDRSVYMDGKQEGTHVFWYENGKVKSQTTYKAGEKNGSSTEFYESGFKRIVENYVNDKLNGDYFEYDSSGVLVNHWKYENDEVVSYIQGNRTDIITSIPKFDGCEKQVGEEFRKCQMESMLRFINDEIIYPESARLLEVSGRVEIKFVVGKEGEIEEFEIVNGLSEPLNQEAIRLVKLLPRWSPGMRNGKPVRVWFVLPIVFKLE